LETNNENLNKEIKNLKINIEELNSKLVLLEKDAQNYKTKQSDDDPVGETIKKTMGESQEESPDLNRKIKINPNIPTPIPPVQNPSLKNSMNVDDVAKLRNALKSSSVLKGPFQVMAKTGSEKFDFQIDDGITPSFNIKCSNNRFRTTGDQVRLQLSTVKRRDVSALLVTIEAECDTLDQ
jgi:hypothetical protein